MFNSKLHLIFCGGKLFFYICLFSFTSRKKTYGGIWWYLFQQILSRGWSKSDRCVRWHLINEALDDNDFEQINLLSSALAQESGPHKVPERFAVAAIEASMWTNDYDLSRALLSFARRGGLPIDQSTFERLQYYFELWFGNASNYEDISKFEAVRKEHFPCLRLYLKGYIEESQKNYLKAIQSYKKCTRYLSSSDKRYHELKDRIQMLES